MLSSSGRGIVEWGGIFQFDVAAQEPFCSLGERASHPVSVSSLEQGADPGRTTAHHRSQHPSPLCADLTHPARPGLATARSRLRWHSGVIRPEIALSGLLRAPGRGGSQQELIYRAGATVFQSPRPLVSLAFATQSALSFISKMVPAACALRYTREGHSAILTHTS